MDTHRDEHARLWRLVSDYEELTCGETVAIQHRDYPSLEAAQERKAAVLRVLQITAANLGFNRTNCPELVRRLEAVSAAEAANLDTIATRQALMQQRSRELKASWQRFQSVKNGYGSETLVRPPAGSFAACG